MITISATFTVLQMLLAWCRTARTVLRMFPTINCDYFPELHQPAPRCDGDSVPLLGNK